MIRPFVARRAPLIYLVLTLLIVTLLAYRSKLLIGLLFEDGSLDIVPPGSLTGHGPGLDALRNSRPLIPKIIHQTYRNTTIPAAWRAGQRKLRDLHEDYEYMFWSDEAAEDFIATHYPNFLGTYIAYPHAIQRADSIRYFLLHHYGGIYLDLDISTYRRLDALLTLPAWGCLTRPTGISNDALGSIPKHPFFQHVIQNLGTYDRNWGLPYVTVMYTTGPLFLSVLWKEYISVWGYPNSHGIGGLGRFRVLKQDPRRDDGYGFFRNEEGASWHGRDAHAVEWIGSHWLLVTTGGFLFGLCAISGWCWTMKRTRIDELEEPVARKTDEEGSTISVCEIEND